MQSGTAVAVVAWMKIGVAALVVLATCRFVTYLTVTPLVVPRKMDRGIRLFLGRLGSLIQSIDPMIKIIDNLNSAMLHELPSMTPRLRGALPLVGLTRLVDVLELRVLK